MTSRAPISLLIISINFCFIRFIDIEVPEVQFKMKSHDKQMRNNTTMNNNGTMDGNMTNNLSTINVTDVSNRTNSSSNKSLSDVQMYHINEGESANLSCSAISNPVAKFRWNKNINETYREGNIILFNNITREDAGLYVCTAFNMVKYRTSAASRIVVRCKYFINVYQLKCQRNQFLSNLAMTA